MSEAAAERRELLPASQVISAHWPLFAGLALLAVPTFIRLGQQTWATEAGAHGPIVLATGLWLLVYRLNEEGTRLFAPPRWTLVTAAFIVAAAFYIFGRAYDLISIEAAGLYGCFILFLYRCLGCHSLRQVAFPLFYIAFIIPPPGWLIDPLTSPLRVFVSRVATAITFAAGYPISREGVSMLVGPYQLLVEDACSGLNSIVGLTAVSLFYVYLMHRASYVYGTILILFVIPIAIVINIVRVVVLILLTYHYGDAVAQGFLHVTAGLILFAAAVLLTFGVDLLMQRFVRLRAVPQTC